MCALFKVKKKATKGLSGGRAGLLEKSNMTGRRLGTFGHVACELELLTKVWLVPACLLGVLAKHHNLEYYDTTTSTTLLIRVASASNTTDDSRRCTYAAISSLCGKICNLPQRIRRRVRLRIAVQRIAGLSSQPQMTYNLGTEWFGQINICTVRLRINSTHSHTSKSKTPSF
jgi:hypothetical protein